MSTTVGQAQRPGAKKGDWVVILGVVAGLSIAQKPLHPVFLSLFWAHVFLLFSLISAHFVCNLSMLV
jgi:hypothetical protein